MTAKVFGEKERLGPRRRTLGEWCRIERRCGWDEPFVAALNRAFDDHKAKELNERCVSVLRDGQQDAIVLLRRMLAVMTVVITMAMLLACGVLGSISVGGMVLCRGGNLLEGMVHPMRRGGDQKKAERRGNAQV
jgi:hypothetical protein